MIRMVRACILVLCGLLITKLFAVMIQELNAFVTSHAFSFEEARELAMEHYRLHQSVFSTLLCLSGGKLDFSRINLRQDKNVNYSFEQKYLSKQFYNFTPLHLLWSALGSLLKLKSSSHQSWMGYEALDGVRC